MTIVERFLHYVKIDTQSDPSSTSVPSTSKQKNLGKLLVEEMLEMGIEDAHMDEYGIVYGSIPANTKEEHDIIGFISHMDTSPEMSGANVKPRIIRKYDGGLITLDEKKNITMDTKRFPTLADHIGHDLIVTDGSTLLGADDKAGISEIMDMAQTLLQSDMKHGKVCIAFTCDEEIGNGVDHFDMEHFGADYAYTVDGSEVHSINYENFNAAQIKVHIQGESIHPGEAKGKMINALQIAMKFHDLLPEKEDPALTEGREGFHHIIDMHGACEAAEMEYIVRNHDRKQFERQKQDFVRAKNFINESIGKEIISLEMSDTYYNMYEYIKGHMEIVEQVGDALKEIGIEPTYDAVRGGTDGAVLSQHGLLTPNIGTGGFNYHGKYEYVSIQSMRTVSKLLLTLVKNVANRDKININD